MIDVKDLLLEELSRDIEALGIEKFRAGQILEWVYKKYVCNFDKMTNLPVSLRNSLKEKFYISAIKLLKEQVSKDGTRKFLFELDDGERIESVFIPSKGTNTVCVSSQVGCKFACRFCASGKGGFVRNLRPAEIINQVLESTDGHRLKDTDDRRYMTNIVFMGMGEPLDNYDNVLKAVRILNAPYGLGIGQRKITISTCGIIPAIKRLMEEDLQVELSVSLHSPDDKVRSSVMAVNKRYPIKDLMAALKEYIRKTNRQVTFEYILIKGVNDSVKDAQDLEALLKGMLAKVNLISFNPVENLDYVASDEKVIRKFKKLLDENGVVSTIRVSRGHDIEAACGQLRSKRV